MLICLRHAFCQPLILLCPVSSVGLGSSSVAVPSSCPASPVAVGPSSVQSGCPGSSFVAVPSSFPASFVAVSSVHANSVGFVSTPPCRMSSFASGSVSPGSIAAPSVRSVWSSSVPNRPVSSFAQQLRRVASPVWPPVLNCYVSSSAQPFVLPRVIVGPPAASPFCRPASCFPLVTGFGLSCRGCRSCFAFYTAWFPLAVIVCSALRTVLFWLLFGLGLFWCILVANLFL